MKQIHKSIVPKPEIVRVREQKHCRTHMSELHHHDDQVV
jgi:predicted RNA-binding protein YlqC (UPF0109 family)